MVQISYLYTKSKVKTYLNSFRNRIESCLGGTKCFGYFVDHVMRLACSVIIIYRLFYDTIEQKICKNCSKVLIRLLSKSLLCIRTLPKLTNMYITYQILEQSHSTKNVRDT